MSPCGCQRQQRNDGNVEIEDVNAGTYNLVVGGVLRGTINFVALSNGIRGNLEFDTEVSAGKLPLNFTVAAQKSIIRQGATVYFERTFPQQ